MKKYFLPSIILLTAISVSGSAAFYSVFGLSKLFSGASLQVIIMASSLEISKIVTATLLHHYWKTLHGFLKFYLVLATAILIIITSIGIYGFLSAAYQETANADKITTRQIELVDTRKQVFEDQKSEYQIEKNQLVASISELREGLSKPGQIQYIDRETGEKITTTSAAARRSLENQLKEAVENRNAISEKIQNATDSIGKYEIKKIELLNSADTAAELGPLKYVSSVTNIPMDMVVNYLLLTIIFVFDPLAIALVLAANFAFSKALHNSEFGKKKVKSDTASLSVDQLFQKAKKLTEKQLIKNKAKEPNEQKTDNNDKNNNTDEITGLRKVVQVLPDGDVITEEVIKKEQPAPTKKKILSPSQMRNMSSQAIKEYLQDQ